MHNNGSWHSVRDTVPPTPTAAAPGKDTILEDRRWYALTELPASVELFTIPGFHALSLVWLEIARNRLSNRIGPQLKGMKASFSIRRFEIHEWQLYRTLRLRALADSPDAFGSTLAHEQGREDEQWIDRLRGKVGGVDHPIVAELRGDAVGLAWGRIEHAAPALAHLYQMWDEPNMRSRGVGRTLLDAVTRWAASSGAKCMQLDATLGNSYALQLYRSAGFVNHGDPKPLRPGSTLLSQTMRLDF